MRYRAAAATILAIGSVGLAACGEASDEEGAIAAVRAWHEALMAGDREGCNMLTADARRTLELEAEPLGFMSCPEVVELVGQSLTDGERRALRSLKIRKVVVSGDRATIHNRDVDIPSGIERTSADGSTVLRKVTGAWKLERLG